MINGNSEVGSSVNVNASASNISAHWAVLVLFVAPILEEFFFRDLVFRALYGRLNRMRIAILLSSIFFMVAHMTLHPGAFLLGLISCWLVLGSRSILPSIVFHSISNGSWFFLPVLFPNLHKALTDLEVLKYFY